MNEETEVPNLETVEVTNTLLLTSLLNEVVKVTDIARLKYFVLFHFVTIFYAEIIRFYSYSYNNSNIHFLITCQVVIVNLLYHYNKINQVIIN